MLDSLENEGLVFDPALLLANDKDPDQDANQNADTLHISRVGQASGGSVFFDQAGLQAGIQTGFVRFIPEPGYSGPASFTYWVADGRGAETPATVHIQIAHLNLAPSVVDERIDSDEDTLLLIAPEALLANDLDPDGAPGALRISAVGPAAHGTVTLRPDGSIAFTPQADYVGTASFQYTVTDGAGGATVGIAQVELANVNDAPRLQGETVQGREDTPLDIAGAALLANDADVDNARGIPAQTGLVIVAVGKATHGSVVLNADGSIRFTPEANYHSGASGTSQPAAKDSSGASTSASGPAASAASAALATFEYTVRDPQGALTTGVATVRLAPVNDAPIARGETAEAAEEDTVLQFTAASLLANETDIDTATTSLTISAVGEASHGTVALAADGAITFTPELNYSGQASFAYTVSDGAGGLSQAAVTLQFTPVNDAPTLTNDTVQATEDASLVLSAASLLANDRDVDREAGQDGNALPTNLTITAVGDTTHGSVALLPDGSIRFTPEPDFNGTASFSYTVRDNEGGSSTATAQVQVGAVNDAPIAAADVLPEQREDTNLLILASALLTNDRDVDTSDVNAPVNIQTLRLHSVSAIAGQTHGSVSLDADGNVLFVPEADYAGPVSFAYTVADGAGGESGTHASSTASFTIANVNDAPVLLDDLFSAKNQASIAISPAALLANDRDPDAPYTNDTLRITGVSGAQHGSVALAADGTVLFTPEAGFAGVASFTYEVSDGQGGTSSAVAEVNTVNLAPVATGETVTLSEDSITTIAASLLLANERDADNAAADLRITSATDATHGSVHLNASGDVVFTPEANYFGAAQFSYTVADGDGGLASATATLNIQSVNDAPTVTGESATFEEDQIAVFSQASLLSNDTDVETPGSLSIAAVGNASGGEVQLAGGQVQFTPWANHTGAASFTYTVADGQGGFTQAAVSMDFSPVNDAPVVNSESFDAQQDAPYSISFAALLANDTDAETPGGLFVTDVWGAQNVSVTMTPGGIEITPTPGFSGQASFSYTVSDPEGATSYGTTTINVTRANHNPVATDDSFSGLEDMPLHIGVGQLLGNDTDPDTPFAGDALTITGVSGATNGTVSLVAGSHMVFTPNAEYSGAAQFSYEVSDGKGGVSAATAYLTVNAVNDAPVVDSVFYDRAPDASGLYSDGRGDAGNGNVYEERDVSGNQGGTITAHDPDGSDQLSFSIAQGPVHGSASIDANGNWLYQSQVVDPYRGADAFTVQVTDSGGASTAVTVEGYHGETGAYAQEAYAGPYFAGAPPVAWTPAAPAEGNSGATRSLAVQDYAPVAWRGEEAGEEVAPAPAERAPATAAEIARQAQLFNSWVNTAPADTPPLAFVPMQGATEVMLAEPVVAFADAANDLAANPLRLVETVPLTPVA